MEYEILLDDENYSFEDLKEKFNELGSKDWNLCHSYFSGEIRVFIFKREIKKTVSLDRVYGQT